MEINFKLIPHQSNPNYIYTINFDKTEIIFKDIIKNFIHKGYLLTYLSDTKFISNGKQFNNMNDKITTDNTTFYIFTNSDIVKDNLKETIYKNIPQNIINDEPLEDTTEITIDAVDQDDINTINDDIKDTLTPELLDLLHLCVQKPELLNKVNSYLQSGNIETPIELEDINDDEFIYNDDFNYINTHFSQYQWDNHLIKNVLNKYKGHLNLSIRYLINTIILSTDQ
jgi:hypothetical protein